MARLRTALARRNRFRFRRGRRAVGRAGRGSGTRGWYRRRRVPRRRWRQRSPRNLRSGSRVFPGSPGGQVPGDCDLADCGRSRWPSPQYSDRTFLGAWVEKAIEAVRRWRFEPAKKNGQPVAVRVNTRWTLACSKHGSRPPNLSSPGGSSGTGREKEVQCAASTSKKGALSS